MALEGIILILFDVWLYKFKDLIEEKLQLK